MGKTTNQSTGKQRVLTVLTLQKGKWVSDLYMLTNCMVHSRVADLRRDGHTIQHKVINGNHCYRLLDTPEETTT